MIIRCHLISNARLKIIVKYIQFSIITQTGDYRDCVHLISRGLRHILLINIFLAKPKRGAPIFFIAFIEIWLAYERNNLNTSSSSRLQLYTFLVHMKQTA